PFSSSSTSSKLKSSIGLVPEPYGSRASTRGMVSVTKRESSESRNDRHLVYSAVSKIFSRSRGLDSSFQLSKPNSLGEPAVMNGQNAAAATFDILLKSSTSSGWLVNS